LPASTESATSGTISPDCRGAPARIRARGRRLTEEELIVVSDANKDVVRRWVEDVVNAKDLDACDRLIATEYTEHAAMPFGRTAPGRVPGPATMRQTAQFMNSAFPDMTYTIDAMIAEDDVVALQVTARATHLGPLGGVVRPPDANSSPVRVTGSASRTASSRSIGPPATI
jgi:predicted SnoaL-like aldol condensation-catalyzing enzyme